MKRTLCGLVVGIGAALGAGQSMQSLRYGISSDDPVNYVATTFTLLTCAFVAGYLPARRASRVDPLIALPY